MNRYEFKDSEGNDYRLFIKEPDTIIQGRFKKDWYQKVDPQTILNDVPFSFILNKKMDTWLSLKENEILCKDSETDQYLYRLEIKKDEEGSSITTVHLTNKEGADTTEILADIYSQSNDYAFLERVEDKGHIAVWADKNTHEPTRIELPRYDLEFEIISVGKERRAYCKQLPGYFLAPQQHVKALGDVTSYLVMQKEQEKGNTKQVVWMPFEPMQSIEAHPLITTTKPQPEDKPWSKDKFIIHDVDPQSGKLMPRTEEGRLHLAMVYLWEKDYTQALTYLRGYGSQLALLPQVIEWILALERKNHDNTPHSKAVLMYAHFLKIRNQLDFEKQNFDEKKSKSYLEDLVKDYDEYLTLREQIGHLQLNPDEELLILKSLPTVSPLASYRWNALSAWEFFYRFPLEALEHSSSIFVEGLNLGYGIQNFLGKKVTLPNLLKPLFKIDINAEAERLNKREKEKEILSKNDLEPLKINSKIDFLFAYKELKAKITKKSFLF